MKKPKSKKAHPNNGAKKASSKNPVTFVLSKTYSQTKSLLAPFFLKRMKLKQRFLIIAVLSLILVWQKLGWLPTIGLGISGRSAASPEMAEIHDENGDNNDHLFINPIFTRAKDGSTNKIPLNPKFNVLQQQQQQQQNNNDDPGDQQAHPPLNAPVNQPPAKIMQPEEIWNMAASFVNEREIYPADKPFEMSLILRMMATTKIIAADVLPRGTQLKLMLVLKGGQKVVFKPKRFERDFVVPGNSWDGFDRHNAEVAGFHLDSILHFRRAPLVVGRILDFRRDILKVASDRLKATTRYTDKKDKNGDPILGFFGKCYYCKEEDLVAPDENGLIEGTLTLWIEKPGFEMEKLRHPYQRTYTTERKARWETDEKYCNLAVKKESPYDHGPRLLDITDASVFDYLIGNGDRHHYEIFGKFGNDAFLIMLDNAKSFGNSSLHDKSILSPLRQCCVLRSETYDMLTKYRDNIGDVLDSSMKHDPIYPVITQDHVRAMNMRMEDIFVVIESCLENYTPEMVIVDEWRGLG